MRAFDVIASAAGYNACCEIIQSGRPSLLVPNTMVADDQARRADLVSRHASVVVSSCETPEERREAVELGIARVAGLEREGIAAALEWAYGYSRARHGKPSWDERPFGDGASGPRIAEILVAELG